MILENTKMDFFIKNYILMFLIYPLPYISIKSKNEIKLAAKIKLNKLMKQKYKLFHETSSFVVFDKEGKCIIDFVLNTNDPFFMVLFE